MPSERDASIDKCAAYLRAVIPPPKPPVRKPQKSFATLAEGQRLEQLSSQVVGGLIFPAGSLWDVSSPSNLGVVLTQFEGTATLKLTSKEWKLHYKKARKARKKKVPSESP